MIGGTGDDIYLVDNAGGVVTEKSNEGNDAVNAAITYTLAINVENLTLTGTSSINGIGNSGNNIITGNAGNNILEGGGGADTMIGGTGDDAYVVDNTGDVVTDSANEGTDAVNTSVNYTLGANIENLTLMGVGSINGTGNSGDNLITGNVGNNTLDGSAGAELHGGWQRQRYLRRRQYQRPS